jgi:hypothetical protein
MRRTRWFNAGCTRRLLCRRRLSSPKQKGMTRAANPPGRSFRRQIVAPTSVTDGAARMRRNDSLDVSGRNRWHIRGNH